MIPNKQALKPTFWQCAMTCKYNNKIIKWAYHYVFIITPGSYDNEIGFHEIIYYYHDIKQAGSETYMQTACHDVEVTGTLDGQLDASLVDVVDESGQRGGWDVGLELYSEDSTPALPHARLAENAAQVGTGWAQHSLVYLSPTVKLIYFCTCHQQWSPFIFAPATNSEAHLFLYLSLTVKLIYFCTCHRQGSSFIFVPATDSEAHLFLYLPPTGKLIYFCTCHQQWSSFISVPATHNETHLLPPTMKPFIFVHATHNEAHLFLSLPPTMKFIYFLFLPPIMKLIYFCTCHP